MTLTKQAVVAAGRVCGRRRHRGLSLVWTNPLFVKNGRGLWGFQMSHPFSCTHLIGAAPIIFAYNRMALTQTSVHSMRVSKWK